MLIISEMGKLRFRGIGLPLHLGTGWTRVLTTVIPTHWLLTADGKGFSIAFSMTPLVTALWVAIYNFHIAHGLSTIASDTQTHPEVKPK